MQNKYQRSVNQKVGNFEEYKEKSYSERWATQLKRQQGAEKEPIKKKQIRSKSARPFKAIQSKSTPQNYKKLRNKKKPTLVQDQINVDSLFSDDQGVNICYEEAGHLKLRQTENETLASTFGSMFMSSQGQFSMGDGHHREREEVERAPLLSRLYYRH